MMAAFTTSLYFTLYTYPYIFGRKGKSLWTPDVHSYTVKLGNKERFDKEQIGIKELFMDYQPFIP